MICVGILTVRQEKIGLWQKLRKPISIKEVFTTQVKVIVAESALTQEECKRMPRWILRLIYQMGIRFLQQKGCEAVAPEETCATLFGIKDGGFQGIHTDIPAERFWHCLEYLRTMNKNPIPRHAYIRCGSDFFPDEKLLESLCSRIESWTFCVDDKLRFSAVAEQLCTEYGIYPNVCHKNGWIPEQAMLFDFDTKTVRIDAERMADGMELVLDLHGYQVNQDVFFKELPLPMDKLNFQSWTKGKKRLTMQ